MSFAGTGLPPEDRSGESDRERIECLFGEALDLDPGDREEFVRSACAGNDAVLRSVLELLKAHEQATGFLERPALHPQSAWSQTQTIETSPWSARALSFIEGQIVGGRFRILSFIDQGGMGEVYSALDLHLQQPVALKTIRPTIAARPEVIERFKREVKQSLRVTHLNVCRVHQIACHQDQNGQQVWFLTMELLEGATLKRDLAETGPMPFKRALPLIRQLVAGLACAHEAGIVHRDLKPGNLILVGSKTAAQRLVITDFGLAVSPSLEEADYAGTPAYMAPEQARRGPVGAQADIFAMGLIICEMLAGDRPRLNLASASDCAKTLNEWLSSHSKIPSRYRSIARHCLQYRPEDRFTDARDLVVLLERRRWSAAERLGTVAAILLALIASVSFVLTGQAERIANAVQLTPDYAASLQPNLSPNGKFLTYMSNRADPENVDIWFQSIPAGQRVRLTKDPAEDSFPNVSPDGKKVAFRSERSGGGLYLINSDGTGETLLVPKGRTPIFSPDGRAITYWLGTEASATGASSYVYSLLEGRSERLAPGFSDARYPTWSPDGKLVLIYGCGPPGSRGACPEWWAVDPNGNGWSSTGLLSVLTKERIQPDFPPVLSVRRGHFFLTGQRAGTYGVWDIATQGFPPRAAGHPLEISKIELQEKAQAIAESGAIATEHQTGALHVWRFGTSPPSDRPKAAKLTDALQVDCCPAASGDGRLVYFTRLIESSWRLMKLDAQSGRETAVDQSPGNQFWPLPGFGNDVVFESRLGDDISIRLWKDNSTRVLCNGCSHPGAWLSKGKQLFYSTRDGSIAILNLDTGLSTTVIAANRQYTLANPDWNRASQRILFTVIQDGASEIFSAHLNDSPGYSVGSWTALSSKLEDSDLARWSEDGSHYYYFSRLDGSYCVWGNSFDPRSDTIGTPFPIEHYHDWAQSPRLSFAYLRRLFVANGSIYLNVGEEGSTIWLGQLRANPLLIFFHRLLRL